MMMGLCLAAVSGAQSYAQADGSPPPGAPGTGSAGPDSSPPAHRRGMPPNIAEAIGLLEQAKAKSTSTDVTTLIDGAEALLRQPPHRRPEGNPPEGPGQAPQEQPPAK